MAETAQLGSRERIDPLGVLLAVFGGGVALALGLAIGHPHASTLVPGIGLAGLAVILLALARPFPAFLALAGSSIFFMVFDIPGGRGINLFDLLLPCLLAAGIFGTARAESRETDRAIADPRRAELLRATRRFTRAVVAFYSIAALSIVGMALSGRGGTAVTNSTTGLLRAVQGLMLFPLGLWYLRSERHVHVAMRALIMAGMLVAVANTVAFAMGLIARAGLTWFVNSTEAVIGGPNEVAPAMLLLGVLLMVRQARRPQMLNILGLAVAFAMLVASTSRSGLLATATFAALVMPRARWRWVLLAGFIILAAIPLIPHDYWTRMSRTLAMQKGTFEAYTSLIRVYCWKTALSVFLHNPVLGVGYVGYSTVSGDYGALRIIGAPAENYYLETASGMGIPGLIALGVVLVRLFQVGAVVRRLAPAGSLGHDMARYHAPFLIALLVVNLTGSNLLAMVALGQLAVWAAMLVRAGHLALEPRGA